MGFSITPLAQKARTQTIIVDSDLNLGNYDLITTDAKGDTAEFDEFIGGVFNGKLLVNGNASGTVIIGNMITNEFSYTDSTKGNNAYSVDIESGTSYILSNSALNIDFNKYCVYNLTFACRNGYNYNGSSLTFTVKIGDETLGTVSTGTINPNSTVTKSLSVKVPENSVFNVSRNYGGGDNYRFTTIDTTITQGNSVPIYL